MRRAMNFHIPMSLGGGFVIEFICPNNGYVSPDIQPLPLMAILIDQNNPNREMVSISGATMDECKDNAKRYLVHMAGLNRLLDEINKTE